MDASLAFVRLAALHRLAASDRALLVRSVSRFSGAHPLLVRVLSIMLKTCNSIGCIEPSSAGGGGGVGVVGGGFVGGGLLGVSVRPGGGGAGGGALGVRPSGGGGVGGGGGAGVGGGGAG